MIIVLFSVDFARKILLKLSCKFFLFVLLILLVHHFLGLFVGGTHGSRSLFVIVFILVCSLDKLGWILNC